MLIGTDWTGCCKPYYYAMTTTTVPQLFGLNVKCTILQVLFCAQWFEVRYSWSFIGDISDHHCLNFYVNDVVYVCRSITHLVSHLFL
jgi:hypothetical protein